MSRKKQSAAAIAAPVPVAGSSLKFGMLIGAVFLAGCASLIYEVVWIRQLGLSLGSTAVAFSVMLTAFLGGLALGGWLTGRVADRLPDPLKTLAHVELGAAALGVASIPALAFAGRAYLLIAVAASGSPLMSLVLRSLIALLVMLAPATLFGMTFPLATVAGARLTDPQRSAGAVSAASSFGSAVGAVLAGLWLEPSFGLFASAATGAALNLVAAAAVYYAHRSSRS